jgi:hypothetical protein
MTHAVFLPLVLVVQMATMRCAGDTYHRPDIRKAAGVQCWYDWSPKPGSDGIPMIYASAHIGQVLSGDATWLMGFNEPEQPRQANMTPQQAAIAWATVEQTYPDRKLVSPGVMNLTWLTNWRAAYWTAYGKNPKVDALAVHWYYQNDGEPLQSFKRQVQLAENMAAQWGVREVWITEFALYPCWGYDSVQFVKDAYAWLDTRPTVTRAFLFQVFWYNDGRQSERAWAPPIECYSGLGLDDGSLTDIGEAFKSLGTNGSTGWDRRTDITGPTGKPDGKTDILDLSLVAANFGKGERA